MNLLKIFVSAYACEPGLGSEIGVGWHWILEMSKHFEVWALTRESNRHTIDRWLMDNPDHADIHFLYFDLPPWIRFWKKGLRGVHLYYYLWQCCSNSIVKQTMQENGIEIFHHLTYGNVLWKVSSYGQKQCFIWGPVGGLEAIPKEYSRYYGRKSRFIEWLRRMAVSSIGKNKAFIHRCHNANLILCKTNVTLKEVPDEYQIKAKLFSDVAIDEFVDCPAINVNERHINYLMVGRLDAWRGFDLAIEGFTLAKNENPDIHLNIIGSGIDEKRLKALVREREMGNWVTLCGEVPKPIYEKMLAATDVVINASLKEGGVTTSFESVTQGKPQICLDSTGYTRLLRDNGAIIIPQGKREDVIRQFADSILLLTETRKRLELSTKALNANTHLTWEEHGKIVKDMISRTYTKYCMNRQAHEGEY